MVDTKLLISSGYKYFNIQFVYKMVFIYLILIEMMQL